MVQQTVNNSYKNFLQRSSLKYRANKVFSLVVFIRLNAAVFIKIFAIQVRCLFEGGVYLRERLSVIFENLATEAKIQLFFYSLQKTVLVNRFQK